MLMYEIGRNMESNIEPNSESTVSGHLCDLCESTFVVVLRTLRAKEWEQIITFREAHGLSVEGIPRDFTLVECTGCGLVSVFPPPEIRVLEEFYQDYLSGVYDGVINPYDEEFAAERSSIYVGEIQTHASGGRLLDIGCATGALMKMARAKGFVAEGVEVSETAATAARRYGSVYQGDFLDIELTIDDASYEIVTSIDSLEHMARPVAALRTMLRKLKPGGLLFVETPNREAGLDEMSRHLHLFDERTLRRALNEAGFADIVIRPTSTRYNASDTPREGRFIEAVAKRPPLHPR